MIGFLLYCFIGVVLGSIAMYLFIRYVAEGMWDGEVTNYMVGIFSAAIVWPMTLFFVLLAGPFVFAAYLGEKNRHTKKEK